MVGFWWEPSMFQTANFSQYPSVVKTEGESSLGFLLLMCPTLWQPHRLQPARLLSPWDFSILGWVAISFSRDLPDSGIKPVSPALQADSLLLSHGKFFFIRALIPLMGSPPFYAASLAVKRLERLPAMQETQVQSLGPEDPWRRQWHPLQYSFLENPMDGGAW